MTLGNTKGVDILVSHPRTLKMFQLEVKANFKNDWKKPRKSKIHGTFLSDWIMHKKHETIKAANLFYCFVNIGRNTNSFKFYIVPSKAVAKYVKEEHALWLSESKKAGKKVKDTDMRIFRIGLKDHKNKVYTPSVERFKSNLKILIFDFFHLMRLRMNYRNLNFIDNIPAKHTKMYFNKYHESAENFYKALSRYANELIKQVS